MSKDKNLRKSCETPKLKLVLGVRPIFGLLIMREW